MRQTDFSAGEVSPLLHAKTDAPFFSKACRTLRNFFVSKEGAAVSRPGTTFVGQVAGTPDQTDAAVLIPFIAADNESFVLVVQRFRIQFISGGGYVESSPGVRYEVATPYDVADLPKIHYAQVGEVLTLVCPNWDAYELRHVSDVPPAWSLTRAVTKPPDLKNALTGFADVDDPSIHTNPPKAVTPFPTIDADHPAREWKWKVTALCRDDSTGELFETLPYTVTMKYDGTDPNNVDTPIGTDKHAVYPDSAFTLRRSTTAALLPGVTGGFTIIAYNFYRGRGELYGFVGQTTSREFVDVGDEPNNGHQPPAGTDPFGIETEASSSAVPEFSTRHLDRASAVAYFEARRVFAGLTRREADLVASARGDFDNFDERKLFHISGEAVTYAIAARKRGRIKHLVPMDRLLVLSEHSSYHAGGQPGTDGLDYDSVWIPLIEEVGANDATSQVVDGTCFFARTKGRGLRGLVSEGNQGGFKGFNASQLAEHLFRGVDRDIRSMAYAEDPWGVLWVVRTDGVLLSLAYDRERGMLAWARHDFTNYADGEVDGEAATVESVCAVPEGDEDAVYLVVRREIGGVGYRYLERMTSRHERGGAVITGSVASPSVDVEPDYICLDSALRYAGAAVTTQITGLSHLEGKQVYVIGQDMPVRGPFTVVGGAIQTGAIATNVTNAGGESLLLCHVGLLYFCDLETLDVAGGEARAKNKQVSHVGYEVDNAKGIKVGQDFDHLDDGPTREVADGFGTAPLQSTFVFVPVRGTWDYSARACLRQAEPLPVTVLAVTRRIAAGGLFESEGR